MSELTADRTGARQRELWGARARDWADVQEMQVRPMYESALEAIGVGAGTRVLDVGCGAGGALVLAADRGAEPSGLDATPELLAIARERLPGADLREGDIEELPWPEASFDAVTGFNSFQFAGNPVGALAEARRVLRPGALVVMATWGQPEQCEAAGYLKLLGGLLPPPPPGAEGPFSLSTPGALESLVERAGLEATKTEEVEAIWSYPDLATAVRGLASSGPVAAAINHAGEDRVIEAISGYAADYQTPDGGVRLRNVFRYLVARA
jgi:SAM-dependent methyltransferase